MGLDITAYKNIIKRTGKNSPVITGKEFVLMSDCKNDHYHEKLATVPAGTKIIADFAGDFGIYGMVEVDGVIHKVKIELSELNNINFGEFDARNLDEAQ